MTKRELVRRATRMLRRNGFRADGRRKGSVAETQIRFERRLIYTPVGGKAAAARRP